VKLDLWIAEYKSNFPPWRLYTLPIAHAETPYGTQGVSGTVTNAGTGAPLAGAAVTLHQGAGSPTGTVAGTATTAADGTYSINGPPAGQYTLVATKTGFQPGQRDTTVVANSVTEGQDIALAAELPQGVQGLIKAADTGNGIPGATVELHVGGDSPSGPLWGTTTSGALGQYEFRGMPAGGYTVVASKTGYVTNSRNVAVNTGIISTGRDLLLTPVVPPGGTISASFFTCDGDLISGWYWLRDASHLKRGIWGFDTLPSGSSDIVVRLEVLATSRAGGPAGVDADFYLAWAPAPASGLPQVWAGSQRVHLPNLHTPGDPVGYTCTGSVTVPRAALGGAASLVLQISRSDPLGSGTTDTHVAVQRATANLQN
jgi:hypothetical protein